MARYLTPRKTLDLYGPHNGGAVAVKARIADDLRSGRLQARASHFWESEQELLSDARKERKLASTRMALVDLHMDVWRGLTSYRVKDQDRWNWNNGTFHVTNSIKPKKRTLIWGLRFLVSDLNQLFIPPVQPEPPEQPKRQGGRPPKKEWEDFWLLLIQMTRAGQLKPDSFPSEASLYESIAQNLNGRLRESSIRTKILEHKDKIIR